MRSDLSLWRVVLCVCLFVCLGNVSFAHARDVRIALLIGNERGWKNDPKLQFAISGDLLPIKKAVEQAGFTVFATLKNQGASVLRRTLQRLQRRLQRKPRVTTFFFYYSGHADKDSLHMGPRGKHPFLYKEFVSFLDKLRIKRRFGVLDACFSGEIVRRFGNLGRYKNLVSKGLVEKGVFSKLESHDLSKHFPNRGERVRGMQILSSSRSLSFESKKLKGSVFTHFLLQGLRGKADLDRDGKISFNELFLYSKPRVRRATGQEPQQWLFRIGGNSYGFAPAYQSQLDVAAKVDGLLQVVVGNFVWRHYKHKGQRLRLAIVPGSGEVHLKRGRRCFRQKILAPKGGIAKIQSAQWRLSRCSQPIFLSKTSVELSGQVLLEPPRWHRFHWEAQAGIAGSTGLLQTGGDLLSGGLVGFRHRHAALLLGVWGTSLAFSNGNYTQLLLELRGELGFRWTWQQFGVFAGGFFSGGLLLQDLNVETRPSFLLQAGVTLTSAVWLSETFAFTLSLDTGLSPGYVRGSWKLFGIFGSRLGIRLSF